MVPKAVVISIAYICDPASFFCIGTLQDLRSHNYQGNPPPESDVTSRTSVWSATHDSPLPGGAINEERFEARNGQPGFWHEIYLPVDRTRMEASTKTVDRNLISLNVWFIYSFSS